MWIFFLLPAPPPSHFLLLGKYHIHRRRRRGTLDSKEGKAGEVHVGGEGPMALNSWVQNQSPGRQAALPLTLRQTQLAVTYHHRAHPDLRPSLPRPG